MHIVLPCDIDERYTLVAELGHGAHAIVYRAQDRLLDREVAIKVLRSELVNSDVSERFRREIKLTSKLEHPHIAHVYGTGEFLGTPYFVIGLVRGASLAERLSREHQLPVDDAIAITRQVASALAYAHKASIVHRDVKPENILLADDGALLTDFGVARAISGALATLVTSTGTAVGTLLYMSPEQLCAEEDIDGRSDQYALALVLYEMLAGVPAHMAANAEGLRALRIAGQHVPVRTHRASVAPSVNDAIERALSPSPADRFHTVVEFMAAIDGAVTSMGVHHTSGTQRTLAAVTPTSSRRWQPVGAALLALSVLAVLGAQWLRNSRTDPALVTPASRQGATPFLIAAAGDTTRSEPVARALVDELSAWSDVQAGLAVGRGRPATPVLETWVTSVAGGLQATVLIPVPGSSSRTVQMVFPSANALDADSLRLLAGRVILASSVATDSTETLTRINDRPTRALRQYASGWSRLLAGDLVAAERDFADAARTTAVPQAALWRALVGSWRDPNVSAPWRDAARAAHDAAAGLSPRDSLIAAGLLGRANDRVPDGCDAFARATRIDGGSFAAWYGLASCWHADSVVVQDAGSPTGVRFRSSYWSALRAYGESIDRVPSAPLVSLFERLPGAALALNPTRRTGVLLGAGAPVVYAGLPRITGDSVSVFPVPYAQLTSGQSATIPASYQAAVRRGRGRLLELTTALSTRAPSSLDAQLALASALEYAGVLDGADDSRSALGVVRRTRVLARTLRDSLDVGLFETRVRLRMGDFTGARSSIDVLLAMAPRLGALDAGRLTSAAMLIGRSDVVEALLVREYSVSNEQPMGLPPAVAQAQARYLVSAAEGACATLPSRRRDARAALASHFAATELPAAIEKWLVPGDWMGLTCAGAPLPEGASAESDPLLRAFAALRAGDRAAVAGTVRSLGAVRLGAASSAVAWDTRFAEMWLFGQSEQTVDAARLMDDALSELSATMDYVLHDLAQGAALRRALVLSGNLTGLGMATRERCRLALRGLTR